MVRTFPEQVSVFFLQSLCVLGTARVVLILTRSREGTQPGWLTQTGQTNGVFDTTCHHARCEVRDLAGGRWIALGSALGIRQWESCPVFSLVLYILFISTVAVTVLFLCCSIKLPLSQPTNFAFFVLFSSHPTGGKGVIERLCGPLLQAVAKPPHCDAQQCISRNKMRGGKTQKLVSNPTSRLIAQTWPTVSFPSSFLSICSWSTSGTLRGIGYFISLLYCPACQAGQDHDVGYPLFSISSGLARKLW